VALDVLEPMQLVLDFGPLAGMRGDASPARREPRREVVRQVEYAPYPRVRADQRLRLGFTRDMSASGLCLAIAHGAPVGSLLHVTVRGLDGRATVDSLARVVWERELPDGDFLVGLELHAERRRGLRTVRRAAPPVQAVA
jgi:hypothetical protein